MHKRKQKLEVKSEEMISAEPDLPFLDNDTNTNWLLEGENSALDITPSFLYDDFLNLFDPLSSLDNDEPLSQENKEIFQDLRYTSTPKSRPSVTRTFHDSGIEELSTKRGSPKPNTSYNVLHDITDKIDSASNNSFINLSSLSESKPSEKVFKRHVSILRKDFVSKPKQEENSPKRKLEDNNKITSEQLAYYTGIKAYDTAIAFMKYTKMKRSELSSFKMQLITLMKMRLNLEWKDLSFRFSKPEANLIAIAKNVVDIMSVSYEDFLPWHVQRKMIRRTVKSFYVQSLFCEKSGTQVLILIIDTKKPVLFVSDAYPIEQPPLYILNDCSKHLIPGDVLCMCDIGGNITFYKIDQSNTGLGITCLDESPFKHCAFVDNCRKIVSGIISDFTILLRPDDCFDLSKIVKIAGVLTNINTVNEISSLQLQKIYQKSSQLVGKS